MSTASMRRTEHVSRRSSRQTATIVQLQRLSLRDLRRQRDITQAELARRLNVSQASVSKLEKSRPTVAAVRRYVEALGGELELRAVFNEGGLPLDL